jgi:tetratricopeptide (TPR) repeat protein
VYRLLLVVLVILLLAVTGCESELQKRERIANEEAERIDTEFADNLNEILTGAGRIDANDPESVLDVIEKLEELQQQRIGVDPRLQNEFRKTMVNWNNNFLRLANAKYREVVAAANEKVHIQEYEAAIAEMSKYPKVFIDRGPFGTKVENYKKAIEAWKNAPGEAHALTDEVKKLESEKKYEEAIAKCDQYYKSMSGQGSNPAIRFVLSMHISVVGNMLDDMIRNGKYDEALQKIDEWGARYGGTIFNDLIDFLNSKAQEIDDKKSAGK